MKVRVAKEGIIEGTSSTESMRLLAETESKRVLDRDMQAWHMDLLERLLWRDSRSIKFK